MPLIKSKSKRAFSDNVKTEMDTGKPQNQSLAIAYDIKRRNHKAKGGMVKSDSPITPYGEDERPTSITDAIRRKLSPKPEVDEFDDFDDMNEIAALDMDSDSEDLDLPKETEEPTDMISRIRKKMRGK